MLPTVTTPKQRRLRPRSLATLPKAELHLHLEGSMRRTTLVSLCQKHSIPIPPDTQRRRFDDFSSFIDVYVAACDCLRTPSDIHRLVMEVAQDAKSSGALWIEPALSLSLYAHRFGGVESTLRILADAAEVAEEATGVGVGYIVAVERHRPLDEAESLAKIVRSVAIEKSVRIHGRPAVVGFGLHGSEEGYPPRPFADVFDSVCGHDTGVRSLPHAGEIAPFPGEGPKSVLDACLHLGARRIGHGVLIANDEAALEQLVASDTPCLDVCVTSNYLLGVVPDVRSHPLPTLLERGVPCTINSDDPLLFGCTLLSEYELCREELRLDDGALAACAISSFRHSCAPDDLVRRGIAKVTRWLDGEEGA